MNTPEIKALDGKAQKLIVMLHGVGSDGHDLISLVPYIQDELPEYHFLSPHGLEPYDMAPFGRQWFSLQDRNPEILQKLIEKNAPLVSKMIQEKQTELGLSNNETILLGFSQGTMMGMYLALSAEQPFSAMIAFSGRIFPPAKLNNTKTPFCIIHGKEDDIVSANEALRTIDYLKQNNIKYQSLIVPNLAHSIDDSGMEFALSFLKNTN
jgi:phospholipase/carboxylesterase